MQRERSTRFAAALAHLPLVAILRGITPDEAQAAARVLHGSGFRLIEVPLNSPDPFESIARIRRVMAEEVLAGAGTVVAAADVERLAETGADLVVMPHSDPEIIRAAKKRGMICMPGIATPTEAFAALAAGADALKLFPAELLTPAVIKAMRAVLPRETRLLPVGGITPDNMAPYLAAGATGFGLGSSLYKPGMSLEELLRASEKFVSAWRALHPL